MYPKLYIDAQEKQYPHTYNNKILNKGNLTKTTEV